MKLIIGLGNPGKKYVNTHHNLGFMALDFLREKSGAPKFKMNKKCNAEISKNDNIIFAKPQTFMNNSGESVSKLLSFFKIAPEDISVIHDDLDLEFGKVKIGAGHGAAGHNGVKSIIGHLGTQDFNRIRLGIGRPHAAEAPRGGHPLHLPPRPPSLRSGISGQAEDYVLQKFSPEETKQLPEIFKKISV